MFFWPPPRSGGIHANNAYRGDFIYQNLAVQLNVIEAARHCGVKRLLFLGSSCVYPRDCHQPIREEDLLTLPLEPTSRAYAIAKISGIEMCGSYNRQYETRFLATMPPNLYGPNDNYDLQNSHVLPALIRKVHEAKMRGDATVTAWGTGSPRRKFLYSDDMAGAYDVPMDSGYWLAGLLAVLGFQLAGEVTHLYASWRVYSLRQELSELAVACIVVGALLVVAAFLAKTSVLYSRVVMVLWWTLALGCLALERVAVRALLRASRARGRNMRSLAIAGAGDLARRVAARVLAADSLGLRPIGFFDDGVPVGTKLPQREGPPALAVEGNLEALVKLAKDGGVDYVYVALPLADEERVMALIHDLSDTTASVFFVPDFFVFEMLQARWTDIDGMPAYSTRMLSNGSCVTPTILNLCLTQSTWRAVTLRVCTPMKWRWAKSSPGFAFHAGFSYHQATFVAINFGVKSWECRYA